jgi:hypothetical protein
VSDGSQGIVWPVAGVVRNRHKRPDLPGQSGVGRSLKGGSGDNPPRKLLYVPSGQPPEGMSEDLPGSPSLSRGIRKRRIPVAPCLVHGAAGMFSIALR